MAPDLSVKGSRRTPGRAYLRVGVAVGAAVGAAVLSALLFGVPSAGARGAATIKVTRCPTSYGVTGEHGPAIPATITTFVNAAGLRAYSNGWTTTLGPVGWHCSGGVGADGNRELSVLPPYVSQPSSSAAAITVDRQWNGVAISTACSFFPELARGYGVPCRVIPRRELVDRLSGHAVAFEDPPGVQGTGNPSGGAMPANGVVAYSYEGSSSARRQLTVGDATCALPQRQHALCTAILDDFLSRWSR